MASNDPTPSIHPANSILTSTAPLNGLIKPTETKILSTNLPSLTSEMPPSATSQKKTVICVFCGASPGHSPSHMAAAHSLAKTLHENGAMLIYGGGTVGLMGEIARTLVSLSGPDSVHGIIPSPLVKYERGPDSVAASTSVPDYSTYGKTTVVKDMHTRKQMMAREVINGGPGSGFIALSGGYGTLEELMEIVTWNQLGIHDRGVVVYNVDGYWDGLLKWVDGAVGAGFVGKGTRGIVGEGKDGEECVRKLKEYVSAEGRFKLEWGSE